jgi:5-methylthioadenosine/S-adenosylhomocysteine deaminase
MRPLVVAARWVAPGGSAPLIEDGAVAVAGGRVVAVGPAAAMQGAERIDLGDAILLPGLVNAHQHGRGLSQILLGHPDDALEPWIAGRRRWGPPDIHAITRLAAEQMLAAGVTAALHANYAWGTGDHEGELRAAIRAYLDAGLRATVCVGAQDRGLLVYPDADEAAVAAALEPAARALAPRAAPYMADAAATVALMDRLSADFAGEPLIRLAYGPAGPQWASDDLWRALARDAARRGAGLHFHLLESPAQATACARLYPEGVMRRLEALGVLAAPCSCAHGVRMTADDMDRAAVHGVTVVANPGSNMRLRNGPPPLAALRAASVRVAVGTDDCALTDDADQLRELRLAALLARGPDGAPDAAAALTMGTAHGAAAAFLEAGAGTLAPGAPADLAAFRAPGGWGVDPLDTALARCGARDLALTMVGGAVRWAGRPQDAARLSAARDAAMAAADARAEAAAPAAVAALQAALRAHYAAR